MAATALSPGLIASIVVILIIAVVLIIFYFVCRSDDPARDHTCVALLYPSSRRDLQQLRIPLDPVNITEEHENAGYEKEKERKEDAKPQTDESHETKLNMDKNVTSTAQQVQVDGSTSTEIVTVAR